MPFPGSLFGWRVTGTKDPVCGAYVGPGKAKWSAEYKGTTQYFCVETCKEAFEVRPDYYIGKIVPRSR